MRISAITNTALLNNRKNTAQTKHSFKGEYYPSGYYEDYEINIAKQFINQTGDEWKTQHKKNKQTSFSDMYWESGGLNHITSVLTRPFCYDWDEAKTMSRILLDSATCLLWEIANAPFAAAEAGLKKAKENKILNKEVERIGMLICDMKAEKEQQQIAGHIKKIDEILDKTEKANRVMSYQKSLKDGFSTPVEDEKLGKNAEIPNVIMIEEKNEKLGKELIAYTRKNSQVYFDFVQENEDNIEMMKDLDSKLEKAKEAYDKNGTRTLIEVENFGKLIDNNNPFEHLEWMKGLMTACAEDNKATIIFRTDDSSNYLSEALEPHRIGLKVNC